MVEQQQDVSNLIESQELSKQQEQKYPRITHLDQVLKAIAPIQRSFVIHSENLASYSLNTEIYSIKHFQTYPLLKINKSILIFRSEENVEVLYFERVMVKL
jgi:hypothetical protein